MKSKTITFLLSLLLTMNMFAADKNWYGAFSLDMGANVCTSPDYGSDISYKYSSGDGTQFLVGGTFSGGYYVGGCVGVGASLAVSAYTCDHDELGYGLYDYKRSCFVYFGPEVSFDYGRLLGKKNSGVRKFSLVPMVGCGVCYNSGGREFSQHNVGVSIPYGPSEDKVSFCGKFTLKLNFPLNNSCDLYIAPTIITPFKQSGVRNTQIYCSLGFAF